jgi:hypothetical protein
MRAVRLLAILALAIPLSASAKELKNLFPDLARQAQTQVTPIVTINGGTQPGTFTATDGVDATFDSTASLNNLTSQVASQFQRFPIGSTVPAFTFQFDPELNVFTRSTEGLGPLLSERAQTLGKGKFNVSFSYSHVKFDVFEGEKLNNLDLPFSGAINGTSPDSSASFGPDGSISFAGGEFPIGPGQTMTFHSVAGTNQIDGSGGINGVHSAPFDTGSVTAGGIRSVLDADLKVDVFAFLLNYGVTDWLDVGAVVPLLYVQGKGQVTTYGITSSPSGVLVGQKEHDDSFGFGDILLRAKARLFTSTYVDGALRGDLTLPTGNDNEFRGYGKPALGPTLVFSKTYGYFSPHVNAGFTFRTDNADQHTGRWAVGTDIQPFPLFTITTDIIGEHLLNRNVNIGEDVYAFAGGFKVNPWGRLVVAANALVRLNDDGLRADAIPSVSVEYTF